MTIDVKTRAVLAACLAAAFVAACVPEGTAPGGAQENASKTASQADSAKWQDTKALVRDAFPDVPQLKGAELKELFADPAPPLLIDVREPEEYAVSHLPGAVNAQGAALEDLVREAGGDRPVVLYCSVGYRSSRAVEQLRDKGFENISNLEGSIFEWANRGNPLVAGGPQSRTPAEAVHPFDEDWGVLLDAERRSYTPR